jgi:hypothetical protein
MKMFAKDSERRNEKVVASFTPLDLLLILIINGAVGFAILLLYGYFISR